MGETSAFLFSGILPGLSGCQLLAKLRLLNPSRVEAVGVVIERFSRNIVCPLSVTTEKVDIGTVNRCHGSIISDYVFSGKGRGTIKKSLEAIFVL